jgi:hypothetical protein
MAQKDMAASLNDQQRQQTDRQAAIHRCAWALERQ